MTERERLALRLIEYRKAVGMSQAEFAKKIGKAPSVVCAWEKGLSSPVAELLPKIAKVLQITISELCGQADTPTSDQELLDAFHNADIITQRNIRTLLGIERG